MFPPPINSSPPSTSTTLFSFLHISKGWHGVQIHCKILFKLSHTCKLTVLNFLPFQLFRHSYLAQYTVYDVATTWVLTLFLQYTLRLENNSYWWNTKVLSCKITFKKRIPLSKKLLVPLDYLGNSLFIVLLKWKEDPNKDSRLPKWILRKQGIRTSIGFSCFMARSSGKFILTSVSIQHGTPFLTSWATMACDARMSKHTT